MSAKATSTPRFCPCGRALVDWRPICASCFSTADIDDRVELAARGKRISPEARQRLLHHAAQCGKPNPNSL